MTETTNQASLLARTLNSADLRGTRADLFATVDELDLEITDADSEEYGPWQLADGSRIEHTATYGAGWRWGVAQ